MKIYSSKLYQSYEFSDGDYYDAEFGFAKNLMKRPSLVGKASRFGLKNVNKIKRSGKKFGAQVKANGGLGKTLLRNKGAVGKVSRYGFKKMNQAKRFGKKTGTAGSNLAKTGFQKAKVFGSKIV